MVKIIASSSNVISAKDYQLTLLSKELSRIVYLEHYENEISSQLKSYGLELITTTMDDKVKPYLEIRDTGYFGILVKSQKHGYFLANIGTRPNIFIGKDLGMDIAIALHINHAQYRHAVKFAKFCYDRNLIPRGEEITFTGHSKGKVLADLQAYVFGGNSITFDGPFLPENVKKIYQRVESVIEPRFITFQSNPNIINKAGDQPYGILYHTNPVTHQNLHNIRCYIPYLLGKHSIDNISKEVGHGRIYYSPHDDNENQLILDNGIRLISNPLSIFLLNHTLALGKYLFARMTHSETEDLPDSRFLSRRVQILDDYIQDNPDTIDYLSEFTNISRILRELTQVRIVEQEQSIMPIPSVQQMLGLKNPMPSPSIFSTLATASQRLDLSIRPHISQYIQQTLPVQITSFSEAPRLLPNDLYHAPPPIDIIRSLSRSSGTHGKVKIDNENDDFKFAGAVSAPITPFNTVVAVAVAIAAFSLSKLNSDSNKKERKAAISKNKIDAAEIEDRVNLVIDHVNKSLFSDDKELSAKITDTEEAIKNLDKLVGEAEEKKRHASHRRGCRGRRGRSLKRSIRQSWNDYQDNLRQIIKQYQESLGKLKYQQVIVNYSEHTKGLTNVQLFIEINSQENNDFKNIAFSKLLERTYDLFENNDFASSAELITKLKEYVINNQLNINEHSIRTLKEFEIISLFQNARYDDVHSRCMEIGCNISENKTLSLLQAQSARYTGRASLEDIQKLYLADKELYQEFWQQEINIRHGIQRTLLGFLSNHLANELQSHAAMPNSLKNIFYILNHINIYTPSLLPWSWHFLTFGAEAGLRDLHVNMLGRYGNILDNNQDVLLAINQSADLVVSSTSAAKLLIDLIRPNHKISEHINKVLCYSFITSILSDAANILYKEGFSLKSIASSSSLLGMMVTDRIINFVEQLSINQGLLLPEKGVKGISYILLRKILSSVPFIAQSYINISATPFVYLGRTQSVTIFGNFIFELRNKRHLLNDIVIRNMLGMLNKANGYKKILEVYKDIYSLRNTIYPRNPNNENTYEQSLSILYFKAYLQSLIDNNDFVEIINKTNLVIIDNNYCVQGQNIPLEHVVEVLDVRAMALSAVEQEKRTDRWDLEVQQVVELIYHMQNGKLSHNLLFAQAVSAKAFIAAGLHFTNSLKTINGFTLNQVFYQSEISEEDRKEQHKFLLNLVQFRYSQNSEYLLACRDDNNNNNIRNIWRYAYSEHNYNELSDLVFFRDIALLFLRPHSKDLADFLWSCISARVTKNDSCEFNTAWLKIIRILHFYNEVPGIIDNNTYIYLMSVVFKLISGESFSFMRFKQRFKSEIDLIQLQVKNLDNTSDIKTIDTITCIKRGLISLILYFKSPEDSFSATKRYYYLDIAVKYGVIPDFRSMYAIGLKIKQHDIDMILDEYDFYNWSDVQAFDLMYEIKNLYVRQRTLDKFKELCRMQQQIFVCSGQSARTKPQIKQLLPLEGFPAAAISYINLILLENLIKQLSHEPLDDLNDQINNIGFNHIIASLIGRLAYYKEHMPHEFKMVKERTVTASVTRKLSDTKASFMKNAIHKILSTDRPFDYFYVRVVDVKSFRLHDSLQSIKSTSFISGLVTGIAIAGFSATCLGVTAATGGIAGLVGGSTILGFGGGIAGGIFSSINTSYKVLKTLSTPEVEELSLVEKSQDNGDIFYEAKCIPKPGYTVTFEVDFHRKVINDSVFVEKKGRINKLIEFLHSFEQVQDLSQGFLCSHIMDLSKFISSYWRMHGATTTVQKPVSTLRQQQTVASCIPSTQDSTAQSTSTVETMRRSKG